MKIPIKTITMDDNTYAILQIFDWTSDDGKCTITFRVSEILVDIARGRLPYEEVLTHIDYKFVRDSLLPQREPNIAYALSLTPEQLAIPVVGVRFASGGVTLIDGTHRYLARCLRQEELITYHIITIDAVLPYVSITGDVTCQ